jgi:hypothetical protein
MKNRLVLLSLFLKLLICLGCGGKNTDSNVASEGEEKTAKTKALETGSELLQDETPLKQFSMYLDGFHFYNGKLNEQMEAHHYCTQVNEDVTQCIIFDGNSKDAKIMGIEYIITEKLFITLPEEEKKLWHSHVYEVKSGTLVAPGLPQLAENELMEKIVSTYGKTFHTWHTDKEKTLPVGIPQIMMGFTKDGQIDEKMVSERDERFKISTSEKKAERAKIPSPEIKKGANAWEQGEVRQLKISKEATSHH